MIKIFLIIALVVGLILVFIMSTSNNQSDKLPPASTKPQTIQKPKSLETPSEQITQMTFKLNPLNSNESGTAQIREVQGKAWVKIELQNSPKGVKQPIFIYKGRCSGLREVQHALVYAQNGTSQTAMDISLSRLLYELPLAIVVSESMDKSTTFVACGDLDTTNML
ncbi:hypothetical protein HYS97_02820 [Candidatus Daviesbacteria bacterium]|nr:hypothetical protein [Candidatus Daviesbacteria bacterium]